MELARIALFACLISTTALAIRIPRENSVGDACLCNEQCKTNCCAQRSVDSSFLFAHSVCVAKNDSVQCMEDVETWEDEQLEELLQKLQVLLQHKRKVIKNNPYKHIFRYPPYQTIYDENYLNYPNYRPQFTQPQKTNTKPPIVHRLPPGFKAGLVLYGNAETTSTRKPELSATNLQKAPSRLAIGEQGSTQETSLGTTFSPAESTTSEIKGNDAIESLTQVTETENGFSSQDDDLLLAGLSSSAIFGNPETTTLMENKNDLFETTGFSTHLTEETLPTSDSQTSTEALVGSTNFPPESEATETVDASVGVSSTDESSTLPGSTFSLDTTPPDSPTGMMTPGSISQTETTSKTEHSSLLDSENHQSTLELDENITQHTMSSDDSSSQALESTSFVETGDAAGSLEPELESTSNTQLTEAESTSALTDGSTGTTEITADPTVLSTHTTEELTQTSPCCEGEEQSSTQASSDHTVDEAEMSSFSTAVEGSALTSTTLLTDLEENDEVFSTSVEPLSVLTFTSPSDDNEFSVPEAFTIHSFLQAGVTESGGTVTTSVSVTGDNAIPEENIATFPEGTESESTLNGSTVTEETVSSDTSAGENDFLLGTTQNSPEETFLSSFTTDSGITVTSHEVLSTSDVITSTDNEAQTGSTLNNANHLSTTDQEGTTERLTTFDEQTRPTATDSTSVTSQTDSPTPTGSQLFGSTLSITEETFNTSPSHLEEIELADSTQKTTLSKAVTDFSESTTENFSVEESSTSSTSSIITADATFHTKPQTTTGPDSTTEVVSFDTVEPSQEITVTEGFATESSHLDVGKTTFSDFTSMDLAHTTPGLHNTGLTFTLGGTETSELEESTLTGQTGISFLTESTFALATAEEGLSSTLEHTEPPINLSPESSTTDEGEIMPAQATTADPVSIISAGETVTPTTPEQVTSVETTTETNETSDESASTGLSDVTPVHDPDEATMQDEVIGGTTPLQSTTDVSETTEENTASDAVSTHTTTETTETSEIPNALENGTASTVQTTTKALPVTEVDITTGPFVGVHFTEQSTDVIAVSAGTEFDLTASVQTTAATVVLDVTETTVIPVGTDISTGISEVTESLTTANTSIFDSFSMDSTTESVDGTGTEVDDTVTIQGTTVLPGLTDESITLETEAGSTFTAQVTESTEIAETEDTAGILTTTQAFQLAESPTTEVSNDLSESTVTASVETVPATTAVSPETETSQLPLTTEDTTSVSSTTTVFELAELNTIEIPTAFSASTETTTVEAAPVTTTVLPDTSQFPLTILSSVTSHTISVTVTENETTTRLPITEVEQTTSVPTVPSSLPTTILQPAMEDKLQTTTDTTSGVNEESVVTTTAPDFTVPAVETTPQSTVSHTFPSDAEVTEVSTTEGSSHITTDLTTNSQTTVDFIKTTPQPTDEEVQGTTKGETTTVRISETTSKPLDEVSTQEVLAVTSPTQVTETTSQTVASLQVTTEQGSEDETTASPTTGSLESSTTEDGLHTEDPEDEVSPNTTNEDVHTTALLTTEHTTEIIEATTTTQTTELETSTVFSTLEPEQFTEQTTTEEALDTTTQPESTFTITHDSTTAAAIPPTTAESLEITTHETTFSSTLSDVETVTVEQTTTTHLTTLFSFGVPTTTSAAATEFATSVSTVSGVFTTGSVIETSTTTPLDMSLSQVSTSVSGNMTEQTTTAEVPMKFEETTPSTLLVSTEFVISSTGLGVTESGTEIEVTTAELLTTLQELEVASTLNPTKETIQTTTLGTTFTSTEAAALTTTMSDPSILPTLANSTTLDQDLTTHEGGSTGTTTAFASDINLQTTAQQTPSTTQDETFTTTLDTPVTSVYQTIDLEATSTATPGVIPTTESDTTVQSTSLQPTESTPNFMQEDTNTEQQTTPEHTTVTLQPTSLSQVEFTPTEGPVVTESNMTVFSTPEEISVTDLQAELVTHPIGSNEQPTTAQIALVETTAITEQPEVTSTQMKPSDLPHVTTNVMLNTVSTTIDDKPSSTVSTIITETSTNQAETTAASVLLDTTTTVEPTSTSQVQSTASILSTTTSTGVPFSTTQPGFPPVIEDIDTDTTTDQVQEVTTSSSTITQVQEDTTTGSTIEVEDVTTPISTTTLLQEVTTTATSTTTDVQDFTITTSTTTQVSEATATSSTIPVQDVTTAISTTNLVQEDSTPISTTTQIHDVTTTTSTTIPVQDVTTAISTTNLVQEDSTPISTTTQIHDVTTTTSTTTLVQDVTTTPSTTIQVTETTTASTTTPVPEVTTPTSTTTLVQEVTATASTTIQVEEVTTPSSTATPVPEVTTTASTTTQVPEITTTASTTTQIQEVTTTSSTTTTTQLPEVTTPASTTTTPQVQDFTTPSSTTTLVPEVTTTSSTTTPVPEANTTTSTTTIPQIQDFTTPSSTIPEVTTPSSSTTQVQETTTTSTTTTPVPEVTTTSSTTTPVPETNTTTSTTSIPQIQDFTTPSSTITQVPEVTTPSSTTPQVQEVTTTSTITTPVPEVTTTTSTTSTSTTTITIYEGPPLVEVPLLESISISSGSSGTVVSLGSVSSGTTSTTTTTSTSFLDNFFSALSNAGTGLAVAAVFLSIPIILLIIISFGGIGIGRSYDVQSDVLLRLFNDIYEDYTLDKPWLMAKVLSQMFPDEFYPMSNFPRILTYEMMKMFPEQLQDLPYHDEMSLPFVLKHLFPEKFADFDFTNLDDYITADNGYIDQPNYVRWMLLRLYNSFSDQILPLVQQYFTPENIETISQFIVQSDMQNLSRLDYAVILDKILKKPQNSNEEVLTTIEVVTESGTTPATCKWGVLLCSLSNRVTFQRRTEEVKTPSIKEKQANKVPIWIKSAAGLRNRAPKLIRNMFRLPRL